MSERRDEVEAAVDAIIHDMSAVQAALVVKVTLELIVDVGNDGVEAEKYKAEMWSVHQRSSSRSQKIKNVKTEKISQTLINQHTLKQCLCSDSRVCFHFCFLHKVTFFFYFFLFLNQLQHIRSILTSTTISKK